MQSDKRYNSTKYGLLYSPRLLVFFVMMELNFEWDENKRLLNLKKHGIDFPDAIQIFFDTNRLEAISERQNYEEIRWKVIGKVEENILFVVYTKRDSKYRIISARKAHKNERKIYYDNS
jgi:uncharacterized DUF497 family protein